MTGPRKIAHDHLAAAIRAARGNLSAAAKLVNRDRATVAGRVSVSPELQRICAEVLEESKDRWEEKLEQLGMEKDSVVAVLARLNAAAKDRGYSRTQSDVTVSGEVQHSHLHLHVDTRRLRNLDDAQLAALIEERRASIARLVGDDRPPVMIELNPRPDSTDT